MAISAPSQLFHTSKLVQVPHEKRPTELKLSSKFNGLWFGQKITSKSHQKSCNVRTCFRTLAGGKCRSQSKPRTARCSVSTTEPSTGWKEGKVKVYWQKFDFAEELIVKVTGHSMKGKQFFKDTKSSGVEFQNFTKQKRGQMSDKAEQWWLQNEVHQPLQAAIYSRW